MHVTVAKNFWQRLIGLIGRRAMLPGEMLLIPRCSRIHTWGMRFAIDVVWLDPDNRIIAIDEGLGPWRISLFRQNAQSCLEMRAGEACRQKLYLGEKITITDIAVDNRV